MPRRSKKQEAEWWLTASFEAVYRFAYPDPDVHPLWSHRKDRLLGCAVLRRFEAELSRKQLVCLDLAERYADDAVSRRELDKADEARLSATSHARTPRHIRNLFEFVAREYVPNMLHPLSSFAHARASVASGAYHGPAYAAARAPEEAAHADAVRELMGNPVRPVAFDPAWRTSDAVALARSIYESRDFGAMPILADALQDAGCENEDVLNHCRAAGPHVRGCWVVDGVLGLV